MIIVRENSGRYITYLHLYIYIYTYSYIHIYTYVIVYILNDVLLTHYLYIQYIHRYSKYIYIYIILCAVNVSIYYMYMYSICIDEYWVSHIYPLYTPTINHSQLHGRKYGELWGAIVPPAGEVPGAKKSLRRLTNVQCGFANLKTIVSCVSQTTWKKWSCIHQLSYHQRGPHFGATHGFCRTKNWPWLDECWIFCLDGYPLVNVT